MQLIIRPWGEWVDSEDLNPKWWKDYNAVKHHRERSYYLANLENVLHSAAGWFCLLLMLSNHVTVTVIITLHPTHTIWLRP
jgi:hypothetical protein